MRRIKASATALIIAVILFIYVYKPAEHEQHAESPTESSQMIPPADDVAPLAPSPKPIQPVQTVKPVSTVQPAKKAVSTPSKPAKPKAITLTASHYIATCKGCSGVTASGYNVKSTIYYDGLRIVAAPKDIPLYTIMRISYPNGTSFKAIVLDRGGLIKSGKLDVLVASYDEAIRLGRQKVTVQILN